MDVNTLLPLEQRPTELGRIRLGDKAVAGSGKEYPTKLETWRLTSASSVYLEAVANLYGGIVEPWEDAPDEGYFQVLTESRELRVLIPRDLRTLTQHYELWQGGTCERRCDGTLEQISDGPCLCDPADRACMPRTRLSIMLPDIPGLGTWRLETSGYNAATSLPATIELLKGLSTQPWIPAVLRLEQRSKKTRDETGKVVTHRFAVPVLDLPGVTVGKVVAGMGNAEAPKLEAVAPAAAPTARERVAQQRAALEATTSGADSSVSVGPEEASDASRLRADEPPLPADPAGVRAATPESAPGSADTGEPIPAPAADTGTPPPLPASAALCEVFHEEHGRCRREAAHRGYHRNSEQETWK